MKKLITAALLILVMQAHSQTFEGTVKWSMKAEVTDPKMKAQMEHAQKQLNDPANQAKMKEMQEKMNDPQMKAMMEANPQMKAAMEKAMNVPKGGDANPMAGMMLSGLLIKIKGGNVLTALEGGVMQMEVLHLKDQDKSYRIDRKNKTYSEMSAGNTTTAGETIKPEVKVTKTNEKMVILNYNCTKYIASVTERGKTVDQIYWTTTEIKDFDMKALAKQKMGRGNQQMMYDGIDGVPLKIEMITPEAKMIMEVVEIKREPLSASDFVVPTDFTQSKGRF